MKEEGRKRERERLLEKARIIADYQFGRGAGAVLFTDTVEFTLSRTRRIAQIKDGESDRRIATLRSGDGLFTLGIEGAKRLHQHFQYPLLRVVMNEESSEFVRKGETAFCKHVLDADHAIRAYDEVLVVDEQDRLLATGKAMLAGEELQSFQHGVAVKVRHGIYRVEK